MKKILYATDCSVNSAPSLRYAYRLASSMNAKLHVLHVYELAPFVTTTVRRHSSLELSFAEEQRLIAQEYCEKQLRHELGKKHYVLHVQENSSIANGILSGAHKTSADLVIVGMKNPKSLRNFFSENVANNLLDKLEVPLLILPGDTYFHGLSTILYATDFEEADMYALKHLVPLAEPYGALIKVVHIPRKKEHDHRYKMYAFEKLALSKIGYLEMVFCSQEAEDVETGLHECITNEKPDLLVMMEREHGSLYDRLFHRDLVRTMEDEINIPLLVFNQRSIRQNYLEKQRKTMLLATS